MSHVAWSVCLSVCVLGIRVTCAKMAEPIEMQFGRLTHIGPRNHVLDEVQIPTRKWATFEGAHVPAIVNYRDYVFVYVVWMSCAKAMRSFF